MIIRNARRSDCDEIYALFRKSQIQKSDIENGRIPKRGFFEYHLDFEDIVKRTDTSTSIVLDDGKQILGYIRILYNWD